MNNVTDVNANATEAVMNARSIDTLRSPPGAIPKWIEVQGFATPPKPRTYPVTWRAIAGKQWGSSSNPAEAEFERGAPFDQQSVTERARPASLVSLYFAFMSLAVSARAITVASKSTRCRDAISLLAIA